jgi:hypothetical protein
VSDGADLRQFVLLAIAIAIPGVLLLARRERLLMAWLCFCVCFQLLDTSIVTNLPAARIVGLLLIPSSIQMVRSAWRTAPGRALFLQFLVLCVLAIIFGFIFPWPTGDVARAFNQRAPGRATIYLIRTAADLSLTLYVAGFIRRRREPAPLTRWILVGSTVACCAGLLEFVTGFDWYGNLTGLVPMNYPYRMRGLNFEPRALGLIAVQGLLLCLILYSRRRRGALLLLAGVHAMGLFLSGSTSALVVLLVGGLSLLIADKRYRSSTIVPVLVVTSVVAALVISQPQYVQTYVENALLRLTTERIEEANRPDTPIENLSARMDVLDGPPVLFFAANPAFLVIGTGPGLMSLPSAAYIPPAAFYDAIREAGINSPPSSGFLLELSNAGLIGVGLWAIVFWRSLAAMTRQRGYDGAHAERWLIERNAFIAIGITYMVQAPVSPIWPIVLGTGLGAAWLLSDRTDGVVQSVAGRQVATGT